MEGGEYIEIAGGSITEIVEEDYNIYAGGHIINTAAKSIIETGENKGVVFGKPLNAPLIELRAKCIVQFRPHNNWKGDFGFDWMRFGDTSLQQDNWYKNIIGKNRDAVGRISESTNYGQNLVPGLDEYEKLLKQFLVMKINWKNDFYIVPWLTLFKNKTAILSLKIEIEEPPKKLKFKYDEKLFELNHIEIANKGKGKRTLPDFLKIKCIGTFNEDQFIDVMADDELAGRIKIHKNGKVDMKKVHIVLAKVRTNASGTMGGETGNVTGEIDKLKKYLGQALITPQVVIDNSVNLSTDSIFTATFLRAGVITYGQDIYHHGTLHNYMLTHYGLTNKYPDHFIIYVFDLPGISGNISVGGEVFDIPSNNAMVFSIATRRTTALVHEFLHGLGLHHTFGNQSTFTFTKGKTENIMDYLEIRCAIWKWQWDVIRKNKIVTIE